MNGDGREFVELKQEFRDYKDRQMDANTDIKARLTSIDASLSALAPIITAHNERFNTIESKCTDRGKSNATRIDRLEKGALGTLVAIAGFFLTAVWQGIFPPKIGG